MLIFLMDSIVLVNFFLSDFCRIGYGRIAQFFLFDSVAFYFIDSIEIDQLNQKFIHGFGRLVQFFSVRLLSHWSRSHRSSRSHSFANSCRNMFSLVRFVLSILVSID
jgi:hypothetical protein